MTSTGAPRDEGSFTHLDEHGNARMVDVTAKAVTRRIAEARCNVVASEMALAAIADQMDEVRGDARCAGLLAAKLTAQLIPLCHPLFLDHVEVHLAPVPGGFAVVATTAVDQRTGVEMEALAACGLAGLVLVAALLPHDPGARMDDLTLWQKSGGRSGTWVRHSGDEVVHTPATDPDPSTSSEVPLVSSRIGHVGAQGADGVGQQGRPGSPGGHQTTERTPSEQR
jgi:cyclic pyranopterin monophosphate synthase